MLIPFGLMFNEHPERTVSVENALNMQPEQSVGGRAQTILRSCPALAAVVNIGGNSCRGLIQVRELVYGVFGDKLYSIDKNSNVSEIGIVVGVDLVSMATSGDQIFIATGIQNYVYDIIQDTFEEENNSPLGKTVVFTAGRFVIQDPAQTGQQAGVFRWSDVFDAKTWDGLNFATAEQIPDTILRIEELDGRLVLFGSDSIEHWRPSGNDFVPITGTTQSIGIAGAFASVKIESTLCFLASDGSVRILNGYRGQRISTPSVEAKLKRDPSTQCVAYTEEAHTVFEFSTPEVTLCYDVIQSADGRPAWFEKSTDKGRHKVSAVIDAFGKLLAGAYDDGTLYELTRDAYPDVREFTTPHIQDDNNARWVFLDKIELICRSGSGDIPDFQPKCMLQMSRDNGYTWGEEKWRDLGTVGDYAKRVRWRRGGRFMQLALKFRLTDQVDFTVTGVNVDVR